MECDLHRPDIREHVVFLEHILCLRDHRSLYLRSWLQLSLRLHIDVLVCSLAFNGDILFEQLHGSHVHFEPDFSNSSLDVVSMRPDHGSCRKLPDNARVPDGRRMVRQRRGSVAIDCANRAVHILVLERLQRWPLYHVDCLGVDDRHCGHLRFDNSELHRRPVAFVIGGKSPAGFTGLEPWCRGPASLGTLLAFPQVLESS